MPDKPLPKQNVVVRFHPPHRNLIEFIAEQQGRTMSDFIREAALVAAKRAAAGVVMEHAGR